MYKIQVDFDTTEYGSARARLKVIEADEGFSGVGLLNAFNDHTTLRADDWEQMGEQLEKAFETAREEVERRRKMVSDKPQGYIYTL